MIFPLFITFTLISWMFAVYLCLRMYLMPNFLSSIIQLNKLWLLSYEISTRYWEIVFIKKKISKNPMNTNLRTFLVEQIDIYYYFHSEFCLFVGYTKINRQLSRVWVPIKQNQTFWLFFCDEMQIFYERFVFVRIWHEHWT